MGARDTGLVHFGRFKLTADGKAEPLEWLVLQKRGDKQLLLSKKALAQLSFNEKSHSCDWRNSELRAWLNAEFANTSFSAEERSRLLNIPVDSPFEPTVGQLRTVDHDRVFLLNRAELEILLPHPAERLCFQTEPTSQRRGFTSQAVKEACSWWLRPLPDAEPDSAELCMSDGNFCTLEEVKETIALGIRPAIWVKKG